MSSGIKTRRIKVDDQVLFSTSTKNKTHGNANVFKKAESVKEAV